jgi:FeS assembly SUF system protein
MGLFSFLTGNKDGPTATDERPAEPLVAAPASAAPPVEPAPAAAETPAPAETPVEGWDTGALTAPPPPKPDEPTVGPPDPGLTAEFQGPIVEVIKTVYDPEIPVDIYELGLIYDIIVDADRRALVKMTLTSPACPSAQQLPSEVRYKVKAIPEITDAVVEVVWEPPWDKERMSEAAKLQLGFF